MTTRDTIHALRDSLHDPAKSARICRDAAQKALIRQDYGAAQFHIDAALDWEQAYYDARDQGLRLVGESSGRRA